MTMSANSPLPPNLAEGLKVLRAKWGWIVALGVVFLLFNIGLELSLERLRSMQKFVFGLGGLQVGSRLHAEKEREHERQVGALERRGRRQDPVRE